MWGRGCGLESASRYGVAPLTPPARPHPHCPLRPRPGGADRRFGAGSGRSSERPRSCRGLTGWSRYLLLVVVVSPHGLPI